MLSAEPLDMEINYVPDTSSCDRGTLADIMVSIVVYLRFHNFGSDMQYFLQFEDDGFLDRNRNHHIQ